MRFKYGNLSKPALCLLMPIMAACGRSNNGDVNAEIEEASRSYDSIVALCDKTDAHNERLMASLILLESDYGAHYVNCRVKNPKITECKKKQMRLICDSLLINALQKRALIDEKIMLQVRLQQLRMQKDK